MTPDDARREYDQVCVRLYARPKLVADRRTIDYADSAEWHMTEDGPRLRPLRAA